MTGIVASLVDDCSYYILHQCFDHTSQNALCHTSTHLLGVSSLTLSADLAPCKGYQIGKMPDHTFPASGKQASHPLALVYTDLIGPMPMGPHSHARYILTFIDIVLGILFCPFCGPSWTVCLTFIIWSFGLRPLLVTLLLLYIHTKGVNLWDRSSRYSSLPKALLIRLLFLALLNRMDMLRGLIGHIGKGRSHASTYLPI